MLPAAAKRSPAAATCRCSICIVYILMNVFLDSVIPALAELEVAYKEAMADPAFQVRHRNAACCHA